MHGFRASCFFHDLGDEVWMCSALPVLCSRKENG